MVTEAEFLKTYDLKAFDRPSVAVDVAVLTVDQSALKVAVYQRAEHPHLGRWALPGGFVRMDESLDAAAARLLKQKAGLQDLFIEQLYTFGDPKRDPRGRVIAVAYYALVAPAVLHAATGKTLARVHVAWKGETGGPASIVDDDGKAMPLAFDHAAVLGTAVLRMRGKIDYAPVGFELLPRQFTLRALQDMYETVLGERVNKDSFRRRMLQSGLIEPSGKRERDVGHRPAELFRFVDKKKPARRRRDGGKDKRHG